MSAPTGLLRRMWCWLRTATGDNAYELYRVHHQDCHPDLPLLSPAAFYAERQTRKWSGVSRCC